MTNYKEILRLCSQGISQRSIASSLSCGRNTVKRILDIASANDIAWPDLGGLTDADLKIIFYPKRAVEINKKTPDFDLIHKDLGKPSVTLSLLWHEYCDQCRVAKESPYMYTQFCKMYREHVLINQATMRIKRKPAEKLEVDWAGNTATIIDSVTGEPVKAYIFVATLPYSGYSYVEASLDMTSESWITAHINTFKYIGGVAKILVPDNLKTAVTKVPKNAPPILNKSYQELAEYYDTVVLPARVRKPKDKSSVEGTVGVISTWIIDLGVKSKFQ